MKIREKKNFKQKKNLQFESPCYTRWKMKNKNKISCANGYTIHAVYRYPARSLKNENMRRKGQNEMVNLSSDFCIKIQHDKMGWQYFLLHFFILDDDRSTNTQSVNAKHTSKTIEEEGKRIKKNERTLHSCLVVPFVTIAYAIPLYCYSKREENIFFFVFIPFLYLTV